MPGKALASPGEKKDIFHASIFILPFCGLWIHWTMKLPAGDVKKLIGQPYYRLRVGDFRVLFTRDGHIIEVSKIDSRGQIYK